MNFLSTTFLAGIETIMNQALQLDANTQERLSELQDTVLGIHFTDIDQSIFLLPTREKVLVQSHYEGRPTTLLSGTISAFIQRQFSANKTKAFFQGDIQISGNSQIGDAFSQLLVGLDIDWEEQLSHVVGDIAAHQVGRLTDKSLKWFTQLHHKFIADSGEYVQEEARLSPSKFEINAFNAEVDQLRDDIERLAARIERLI